MSSLRPLARPHALYVIYGPCDLILYIGITRDPRARLAAHKCTSKNTWWPWVVRHEVNWFPNHRTAAAAETQAIRTVRPPCNPVIPEENGRHLTTVAGRTPVRSLWAVATELAELDGETMEEFLQRALETEVALSGGSKES